MKEFISQNMITLLIFIAVLAVLVLSHEFGHFIVARKSGMKVEEFGFGFPPRLCGIRKIGDEKKSHWQIVWGNKAVQSLEKEASLPGGTIYSFNLLPLGGFVKIKGEDGSSNIDPESFANKPAWQKASVLVAGVVMNVLVAYVFLTLGLMIGTPQAVTGGVENLQNRKLEVVEVVANKPAGLAGVKAGDDIIKVDNLINPTTKEFKDYMNTRGVQAVVMTFEREKTVYTKSIQPIIDANTNKTVIGVAIADVGIVRYSWYKAIYYGAIATGQYLWQILFGFYLLIKGLIFGSGVAATVSGPVGVAVMTGQVARLGFSHLMQFMAILSLNLAVLNILPIPALDGGRLLFVIISKIKGRPVSTRVEQIVHMVGFIALMILVVGVTVKDVGVLSGGIINFFKNIF